MKTVLIVGAGKSSTYLIDYMLRQAKNNWKVIVSDSSAEAVAEKIAGHPKGEAAIINIQDDKARKELVKKIRYRHLFNASPPSHFTCQGLPGI
ncbi:MAG: hypothetical protein KL787_06415 [Taibaiella sp.]|nr:hypothetical protein [Taibaiella sp.]